MASTRAFRLVSPRRASSAFTGEGARLYGGRWSPPGVPVIYAAGSRALGALELLVHLTTPGSREKPYLLFEILIPDDAVARLAAEDLPSGWQQSPPGPASQLVGARWFRSGKSLALSIPSVLVPEERNLLINPLHPRFSEVEIGEGVSFYFDPRLSPELDPGP